MVRIPLNSKAKKLLFAMIDEQYGVDTLPLVFFTTEKGDTVMAASYDVGKVPLDQMRVSSIGVYFCEYNDQRTMVRLSFDGSQLVGPLAKKNVLTLSDESIKQWLQGINVDLTPEVASIAEKTDGFVLIRNTRGDFFGSGRVKNGTILNFVPKTRRVGGDLMQGDGE